MDWQFPRSIYSVSLTCAAAAEHGLSLQCCLADSGIEAAAIDDPTAEIYPRQELAVIANIMRELGHVPGIGLDIGKRLHISAYGVMAFALASCASVRELAQLAVRYSTLTYFLTDRIHVVTDTEFRLVLREQHLPETLRDFILERDIAALFNLKNELFGDALPAFRMVLRMARPPYAERYRSEYGMEPEFGADQSYLALDAAFLDQPMPQANVQALRFWESQLEELLAKKKAHQGVAGKVRTLLLRRPRDAPDMEAIAAEMCTTSRHLRRLLTAEGTSFRELLDEVRETIAEELLTSARLTVEQVADRLGYNEVSSFTNAFKRWKGMPPRDWRNANLPHAALPSQLA